jgi:outer membrane receptor protein involved in Fe transport
MKGRGVEFEIAAQPTPALTLTASAGWQRVRRFKVLSAIRSMPLTEQQWALFGGVMNNGFGPAYFNLAQARTPSANPDLVYPGSPETQYKFFARYRLSPAWSVSGGPVLSEAWWLNFDHSLRIPSSIVWNFRLGYERGPWSAHLSVENAFNADWYLGSEPMFGANTLLTKAPGPQGRLSLARRF